MNKPYFFIRAEKQFIKMNHKDIVCIESMSNYASITTVHGVYMTIISLRQLESLLPGDTFVRISRGCIISLDHIVSFDRDFVYLKEKQIPFGSKYRGLLEKQVIVAMS